VAGVLCSDAKKPVAVLARSRHLHDENRKAQVRTKYRAIRTEVDGRSFASKLEARRYKQLRLMWATGEIRWFTCQVPFHLAPDVKYVADFLIVYADGRVVVEDVKGVETQAFKIKRKLFEPLYGPLTILTAKEIGKC
jgi:hypothetical protein